MEGRTLDTQAIGVAAGIFGVAIAALGLLLTWYRREEKQEHESDYRRGPRALSKRMRVWLSVAAAVGIIALTFGGVIFTFKAGTTDSKIHGVPSPLTAAQYRDRLGRICSDAYRKAGQIDATSPRKTVLGVEVTNEQDEVGLVRRLVPPTELKTAHANMIALWDRRVSLLSSTYTRWAQLSIDEQLSGLAQADQLAAELAKVFRLLRVPECAM